MTRKRMFLYSAIVLVVAGAGTTWLLWPAHHNDTPRSAKLLTMAAEEAAAIDAVAERLTRQLNIADLQIQNNHKDEALKTLALAATTLHQPEKADRQTIDDFHRIAGWTSVAELCYAAGGNKAASDAYFEAVESLNSVKPEPKRAEYVLSLSEVCEKVRGKPEAIALLVKGSGWSAGISDELTRRFAIRTFAGKLVGFDDLEAARQAMRNELDARWRADTFMTIAQQNMVAEASFKRSPGNNESVYQERSAAAGAPAADRIRATGATESTGEPGSSGRDLALFNKNVQYSSNFYRADLQSGRAR